MTGVDDLEAPLAFLKVSTINQLAIQLDTKKIIPTDDGLLRDWRGVYELAGFAAGPLFDKFNAASSPFQQLVEEWKRKENATVRHFFNILKELDRYDVIDDNRERIGIDIKDADLQLTSKGLSVRTVESTVAGCETVLTYDDIVSLRNGKPLARYDALVLYAEEDVDWVLDMVAVLEGQGISVCLLQRDVVAGTMELEAMSRLVTQRCTKVLVVISPDFFNSENKFYSMLAQSEAIMRNTSNYIPLIYREVEELPSHTKILYEMLHKLRLNHWFWERLCKTLKPDWTADKSNPLPKYSPGQKFDPTLPKMSPSLKSDPETLQHGQQLKQSDKYSDMRHDHKQAVRTREPKEEVRIKSSASESKLSALSAGKSKPPSTPEKKLNGLMSSVKKRLSGLMSRSPGSSQQFSNAVFDDRDGNSSVAELLKTAPEVPKDAPGPSRTKKFGKSRAQSYQQFS